MNNSVNFGTVLLIKAVSYHINSPGGLPDSLTDAASYTTGLVGCVSELSVGNIASLDMLARAERGRNLDICDQ